jgi:hypothetical protein
MKSFDPYTLEYMVFKILKHYFFHFLFGTWFTFLRFEIVLLIKCKRKILVLFAGRGLEFSEEVRESHSDQQPVHHSTEQPSGQPTQVPYPSSQCTTARSSHQDSLLRYRIPAARAPQHGAAIRTAYSGIPVGHRRDKQ